MKLLTLIFLTSATFAYSAQPPRGEKAAATSTVAAPASDTNAAPETVIRLGGYVLDDKHKLAPTDKISFRIIEDRDPAVSLAVTDSGELDVPYVGRIKVTGKTCKELQLELKGLLEQDYYYHASVVVGLDAVSKVRGKVYIWGQVRTQGPIEIPTDENFTVSKAILRAGGFGEFANKKKVRLVRTLPDGTKKDEVLDMEEIFDKGKREKDKTLQEDDFIIVPEKVWNL